MYLLTFLAGAERCKRAEQWESGELRDVPRGALPCKALFASGSTLVPLPAQAAKAVASWSQSHFLCDLPGPTQKVTLAPLQLLLTKKCLATCHEHFFPLCVIVALPLESAFPPAGLRPGFDPEEHHKGMLSISVSQKEKTCPF